MNRVSMNGFVLLLFGSLTLAACATAPVPVSTGPTATSPSEAIAAPDADGEMKSQILLQYEIKSDHDIGTISSCTFRFRSMDSGDIYEIKLEPGQETALVEAPALGEFQKDSIYCGLSRMWRFPGGFDSSRFKVLKSKVNYLGMLKLEFSNQATELKMGYHFDRDYSALKNYLGPTPNVQFMNGLVSAYTGVALTEKILATPKSSVFPDIRVKGEKKAVDSIAESPDLTPCVQSERKINPLFFGRLSFVARYEQNKLTKLQRPGNDHVYTESFIKCVKRGIAAFRPGIQDPVEFTINF